MLRKSFVVVSAVLAVAAAAACSKTKFGGKNEGGKEQPPAAGEGRPGPNEVDANGVPAPSPSAGPSNPNPTQGPGVNPTQGPGVNPTQGPGANPTQGPVPTAAPKPPIPPEEQTKLDLNIVNLNHEAWYLNCFEISLANFESPAVRFCNKGTPATLPSLTVHRSQCNVIRFKVTTTYPEPNTCKEISPNNWTCSYADRVDRYRRSEVAGDRRFFEIFDATRAGSVILQNAFRYLVRPVEGTASSQSEPLPKGYTASTRVYFEDLSDEQMASYKNGGYLTEKPDNRTIDFDDMVFDVRGNNVPFSVEGANSWWAPGGTGAPAEGATPPACR